MLLNKMNISKQYNVYIISGKVYLYYDEIEFTNNIIFDKKNNLIRIGYDKTTSVSDEYLIDINTKTRHSTLKTYPHILLTLNLHTHDKNDNYNKIYPYYGKNTTIIDKKEKFINNKNIYPKYFKLNDNIKYVIDTQIKYNCDANMITDSFLAEIYSIIFHLRVNIIEKELGILYKDFDDYFDESNKIESIEYNFGESLFHNGYYGPTKRTIKLYDKENDTEYNDVDNGDNNVVDDDNVNDDNDDNDDNVDDSEESSIDNDEFMPDIIKLNVNLTNKILELEQKINTMTTNINNKNNNIEYKINENSNIIKYYKNIFYMYIIFFVIMNMMAFF
jgi:hypothetical protein